MQGQARLPEIFDQIPHFTPEVEFGFWGGGLGGGGEMEFSSELRSDLFHITPPPKIQTLTFSSEFRSELFHITCPLPPNSNANFFL